MVIDLRTGRAHKSAQAARQASRALDYKIRDDMFFVARRYRAYHAWKRALDEADHMTRFQLFIRAMRTQRTAIDRRISN